MVLHGSGAIVHAGEQEETETVNLLENGADVNEMGVKDPLDDATALHYAIEHGHAGANVELKDAQGRIPKQPAEEKGQTEVLACLHSQHP